jgi:hypothetical protein
VTFPRTIAVDATQQSGWKTACSARTEFIDALSGG